MAEKTLTENNKSIVKTLITFSLPLILSGILQELYCWADAFIIGNTEGELALGAVGATNTVTNFFIMTITGFTVGLVVLFGQRFGGGDYEKLPKALTAFSFILGAVYVVLAAAGIFAAGKILMLLNTTADTFDKAQAYLQVVLAGVPFLAVYNVYSAALRGIGDTKAPFKAILISSVSNVILDILFVAVFKWGVRGAAFATVLSQAAMTVYIVLYTQKKHEILRFSSLRGSFDREILTQGVRFGIPPMIQSSVTACGNLILQNFMNGFGTYTVIAITMAYRVDCIALIPVVNFGSAICALTAQSFGAGDAERTRKIRRTGMAVMAVVAALLTVLVIPFGARIIALFGAGAEAVAIGRAFFARLASFYILFGLSNAARGYLEGIGDVSYSSAVGIITLLTRIGGSYALKDVFGNMVIAYAEAISWGVSLALLVLRMRKKSGEN